MPNFHLHWLVAWQALDGLPGPAQEGRKAYLKSGKSLAKGLHADFDAAKTPGDVSKFFSKLLPDRLSEWRDMLAKPVDLRDQVTCFSAFMLGACGPDFWTVTTESGMGMIPDCASNHFDLGHYNRTHEQFRVSIEQIGNRPGIQADLERSYFQGMATHIAADLVLHQLVNVSAGAYNLLKKDNWNNEHAQALMDLWNTHNKVEHFWDSYVRYRYLGDLEAAGERVFEQDEKAWVAPLGFPLVETLVTKARKIADPKVKQAFLDRLVSQNPNRHRGKQKNAGGEEVRTDLRVQLELPLLFPALACDRILGDWPAKTTPLDPFIYDRVVHARDGAFPSSLLYKEAIAEKTTAQMKDYRKQRAGKLNEVLKLTYFATAKNSKADLDWSFQNYVTYAVSPDLARLRETANQLTFGKNAFFDLSALSRFGDRAIAIAKSFAGQVANAYKNGQRDGLGDVASFWNLDTGLGFEVQQVPSSTDREVVTRLDFVHVFDGRLAASGGKTTGPGYVRPSSPGEVVTLSGKASLAKKWSEVSAPAFPVRTATSCPPKPDGLSAPFEKLATVTEPDTDAFLDRIRLKDQTRLRWRSLPVHMDPDPPRETASAKAERRTSGWLKTFFTKGDSPVSWRHPFGTVGDSVQRTFALQPVKHRLTLELRVPVSDLGEGSSQEEPALLFYGDEAIGTGSCETGTRSKWLEKAKLMGYGTDPERDGPLRIFTARLLVNVVEENDRIVAEGSWNNVVPYKANKKFYGRNFAVATGRRFVLSPRQGGLFDPTTDFGYYANVSPTEHIFLSIYPLVKTRTGVIDLFSKEEVSRADFDKTVRKVSGLEWKKVVLCYQLDAAGFVQLDRTFVDGLDVAVQPG